MLCDTQQKAEKDRNEKSRPEQDEKMLLPKSSQDAEKLEAKFVQGVSFQLFNNNILCNS